MNHSPPSARRGRGRRLRLGISLLVAALITGGMTTSWFGATSSNGETLASELRGAAPILAGRLDDYIKARLLAADVLRRGLVHLDWGEDDFRHQSELVRTGFGGFQALSWVADDGTLAWVEPRTGANRRVQGKNLREHPEAAPYFVQADETGRDTATSPLQLWQGMRGFTTYMPVAGAQPGGFVNAVFDIETVIAESLREAPLEAYRIEILDGAELVWRAEGFDGAPVEHTHTVEVPVLDRTWSFALRPGPGTLARHDRGGRGLLFLAAGLLVLFGGLILYLALTRNAERAEAERARRELAEELGEARRMESLARLASGVAHDFNNILTAVRACADLAGSEADPEVRRSYLQEVVVAVTRGAELTRHLLRYARRGELEARPVDLGEVLEEAGPVLKRVLPEEVSLDLAVEGPLALVEAEPTELHRVVLNLVVNAAEAMPHGGVITVRARTLESSGPRPPSGRWVELSVADPGVGMSAEVRARIFEPFFTTRRNGTGLGLATVHAAVQRFGGHVDVESGPRRGTTFRVWLPATSARAEAPAATAA